MDRARIAILSTGVTKMNYSPSFVMIAVYWLCMGFLCAMIATISALTDGEDNALALVGLFIIVLLAWPTWLLSQWLDWK